MVLESQKVSGCLVAYFVLGNLLSNNLNTGVKLRLTKRLRRIHNAWRFQFKLNLVFKVQCLSLVVSVVHHLTRRYVNRRFQ